MKLTAMKQTKAYLHGDGDLQQSLVVIFLRGGANGLALVPAVGDGGYHQLRPRIAIYEKESIKLNDRFSLNPLMNGLRPAVDAGALTKIHCVGSDHDTRSHFEAQDSMEHGGQAGGGWIGRFLRFCEHASAGALSAVALGLDGSRIATERPQRDSPAINQRFSLYREQRFCFFTPIALPGTKRLFCHTRE